MDNGSLEPEVQILGRVLGFLINSWCFGYENSTVSKYQQILHQLNEVDLVS